MDARMFLWVSRVGEWAGGRVRVGSRGRGGILTEIQHVEVRVVHEVLLRVVHGYWARAGVRRKQITHEHREFTSNAKQRRPTSMESSYIMTLVSHHAATLS